MLSRIKNAVAKAGSIIKAEWTSIGSSDENLMVDMGRLVTLALAVVASPLVVVAELVKPSQTKSGYETFCQNVQTR